MLDPTGYVIFAKVAETGSFTAAAQALGLSKSSVSKQVARLEDSLGVRLLNRTTRRMSLTEAGAVLFERCRRIAEDLEDARAAVSHLQEAPRGLLRVNAPVSYGIGHLAPVLPGFMAAYPDLKIDLTLADRRIDLVEEGVDIAIRIGNLDDSSLIARRIVSYRRIVLAAPEYWDKAGRPSRPEELERHNCLSYSYLATGRNWSFVDANGRPLSVRVDGSLTANNGETLVRAAEAGLGVIWSPTFLCADAANTGRLEPVLERFEAEPVGVHAVFPHSRNLSTKVRVFVDYLIETLVQPKGTLV